MSNIKKILFVAIQLFLSFQLYATGISIKDSLIISDGANTKVLYYGLSETATNGIDVLLGEEEQPPTPPVGNFDARFIGSDIGLNLGEGILKDYRLGDSVYVGTHIYELSYQVGSGSEITISWDLREGEIGRLQDIITGSFIDVEMKGVGSYEVTNPSGINKLKMTISYNLQSSTTLPPKPKLLSPMEEGINLGIDLDFRWESLVDINNYWFELNIDTASVSVIVDSSLTDTIKHVSDLTNLTEYYWRVRAKNETGWGEYSSWSKFTTIVGTPSVVVLESPLNNSNGNVQPISVRWLSSKQADSYRLKIATDASFTTMVVNSSSLVDTFYTLPQLNNFTTYYWGVKAINIVGESSWSEVWNFQ